MSQQQQQPVSVEDALRLFNEVQQLTVRDAQDNERFDAAAPTPNSKPGSKPGSGGPSSGRRAAGGGGGGAPRPMGNEAELRRQVELSEAVMKKLHAKNKALQQEIDDLKRGRGGNTTGAGSNAASSAENSALRRKIAEQDATIENLRSELQQQSSRGAAGKPPLPNSNNNAAAAASNRARSSTPDADADYVHLLQLRITQLQGQLDQVVEAKLECIRDGESTGRVNKEVKSFFVTSRQKMIDDAAFHEAERALLNQRLAKLEAERYSRHVAGK